MRWLVEVSSLGKTDTQKFCVEAESWQRALQAARGQRGEDGPMSGFSIELLEEGYRAVDPLARVRFVVKRAPDDMPITATVSKEPKGGVAPASAAKMAGRPAAPAPSSSAAAVSAGAASSAPNSTDATTPNLPPSPSSSSANVAGSAKKSAPRAGQSQPPPAPPATASSGKLPAVKDPSKKAATMVFTSSGDANVVEKPVERAAPPAVGSPIPGLPAVKLLTSREQNPNEASPLTYREYAFAVPEGTSEEAAVEVLRAQLRYVEAHVATAKTGKLVNLAVFDVEFTGKPPKPPIATLTWMDWTGEPVLAYPRRGGAQSKPPRPPSKAPPSMDPSALAAAPVPAIQIAPVPQIAAAPVAPPPQAVQGPASAGTTQPLSPQQTQQAQQAHADLQYIPQRPPVQQAPVQAKPANEDLQYIPQRPPVQQAPVQAQAPVQQLQPVQQAPVQAQAPVQQLQPAFPVPQPPPQQVPAPVAHAQPAFAPVAPPAPTVTEAEPRKHPSQHPADGGMVKTPSGRFVRGRISGDELITSLFESMHDLHFLRDALDGGQFCLALATEVLPSRAAIIHFFDIEKREWVVACTRGKEMQKLLTMRSPENDEILRECARKRRALVVPNASSATSERYRQLNGARSLIAAPIMQAGRALGALEIINPLDGMPFTEDEGNAMTYIAEQYAEYLGSRGIVLDRERIHSAAAAR